MSAPPADFRYYADAARSAIRFSTLPPCRRWRYGTLPLRVARCLRHVAMPYGCSPLRSERAIAIDAFAVYAITSLAAYYLRCLRLCFELHARDDEATSLPGEMRFERAASLHDMPRAPR